MIETPPPGSRRTLLILAATGIAVAAVILGILVWRTTPSADTGSGSTVRSLTEILDGEVVVEPDASGTAAVLRVTTTIDVVCAVSFGRDATLGSLATDADMAGGGHRTHQPLMAPLEPGVTYRYRLSGIAADGTLYQSDTLEFTTPVSSATERTNLAPGGTIADVSSEYSDSYRAANAIDGSLATEWSSRGDGDDAFITVDLGAPVAVTGVGFRSREMADGTSITTSFTVTVDDAETFGPFASGPGLSVADLMVTGQVFRIDVATSTGGNTGAVEIEIYG